MEWLALPLVFGGFFVILSFVGGFAGAVAAGGREDRSLVYNFGIGLLGTVIGSGIWAATQGEWPEELTAGVLTLSFFSSIGVAVVLNWNERRRDRDHESDSGNPRSLV